MATVLMQRDLVISLKKETTSNVSILSKLQPMPAELSRLIFKENALEKPTQNVFNHLSFYLISIIDANICASLTWPLYDTKAERAFRNDVARFISDYSNKGLLSPVMSSYLVNPGCFKVTLLMFQLSQLAVNQTLVSVLKEGKKKKYVEMTENYKSQHKEGFVECIERETHAMLSKFSKYLYKRKVVEEIAARFREKITEMENRLVTTNAQNYINNLVDRFLKTHNVDKETEIELLKIKNIHEHSKIFDAWLVHVDDTINSLESTWDTKTTPLLKSCQTLHELTQALISRHTGECERSTYTVEYNHKTDEICTKALQCQVNSEQKYVLCNLTKDGRLSFPNLIRAFVISICFILKQTEIGDEIYGFNEYLEGGRRKYSDIVSTMRILIDKIQNAEDRLQPTTVHYNYSISVKDLPVIPPLPDLANLKATRDSSQVLFDTFTPLHSQRYQFNLRRKHSSTLFAKPQLKSLITPFHIAPRDDFLKSVISCRISAYDRQTTDSHNLSLISHVNRANETIAECSSGFTKQQILRLLSTKKSSSSKKFKHSTERPSMNIKKGGLFNESISDESKGLFRSYSSPNLFENKKLSYQTKPKGRKLSIMQENSPMSILEMSGIAELDREINFTTPPDYGHAESSRKNLDTSSMPIIAVSTEAENRVNKILTRELDLDKEMGIDSIVSPILDEPRKSIEREEISEVRDETPKTNSRLIRKTSSLEKIINRFKKVRANVLSDKKEELTDFKTIAEEKETKHVNFDAFAANRNLLPDLLNPSCNSSLSSKQNDNTTEYLDEVCLELDKAADRKPRQSLGTALGVDQTFLDQFDLID